MTFARLVLAAATVDPLPEDIDDTLPPRSEATALVNHYMANVFLFFPTFNKSHVYSVLDQLYLHDEMLQDTDRWLIFMVLAISSMTQSREFEDTKYLQGVDFAARAMPHADRALLPGYQTQIQ